MVEKNARHTIFKTLLLGLLLVPSFSYGAKKPLKITKLCNDLEIVGTLSPSLNDNELQLMCGDTDTSDAIGHSWQHVPRSQAEFHLKVFLQNRGYFNPIFTRTGLKTGLKVELGEPTIVSRISGEGIPEELNLKRKRRIVGQKLTPALLNELEKWVVSRLQSYGYGCPKVETYANPNTGEVIVLAESGPKQKIIAIKDQTVGGINSGALNRYNAFNVDDYFNGDGLTITERRIKSSGILQGVNFNYTCEKEGIIVNRVGIDGLPRLIKIGVGANTEGVLLLKGSWRNTRMWSNASMTDITTYLSTREQSVSGSMDLYVIPGDRNYLHPEISVSRQSERPYEISEVKGLFHYGTSFDTEKNGFKFRIGPTAEYINTLSGNGPQSAFFLSLETDLIVRSHEQEYYAASPRSGYMFNLHMALNDKNNKSTIDAQRIGLNGEVLYNFKDFDIPLFVLGLRGGVNTIYSSARPGSGTLIPPNFLYYLGGSQNVRGFSRKSLSFNGDGAMTMGFLSSELRLVDSFIPFNLHPFVFYDIGALGGEPGKLDSPFYYSPGFGLRWESPIGAIRGTVARGYTENLPGSNLQFYFSLGEEF